MNNRTVEFRTLLAGEGIEMTPAQAEKAYKLARRLRKTARRLSTEDLWDMEEDDSMGFTREERSEMVNLYRIAKEL